MLYVFYVVREVLVVLFLIVSILLFGYQLIKSFANKDNDQSRQ